MAVSKLVGDSGSAGNPLTGKFGGGRIELFFADSTFTAPKTGQYRVRLWGAGGSGGKTENYYHGGGGGGFAMSVISLNAGDTVQITVGRSSKYNAGGASSFGNYISATGGSEKEIGGVGYGDIAFSGADGWYSLATESYTDARGGGAGSLMGNGILGALKDDNAPINRGRSTALFATVSSIDEIGAGDCAYSDSPAFTGGPGMYKHDGGFPGGGSIYRYYGANGLVIVEY